MIGFSDWGYFGLFCGCFLSATVFPFSSDALFIASLRLGGSVPLTLLWGTLGNWLGGLTSYWIGYAGKWDWMEKWLHVKKETLEKQQKTVQKYGSWVALFTWLPIVGDVFAIALGFYKVNVYYSAFFMLLGKLLRFVMWAVIFMHFKDRMDWIIDI